MIVYIKGKLLSATTHQIVVLVNGIGYSIFTTVSAYSELPALDSEVALHTSFLIRENSQALYGFLHIEERDIFEVLLNVSGIGPKIALSLIGHLQKEDLAKAVVEHDVTTLCKVPGIGRKTAERLLLEIKDKLPTLHSSSLSVKRTAQDPRSQMISDAMNALIHLGYSQNLAEKAIKRSLESSPEITELPQLITTSLKNI